MSLVFPKVSQDVHQSFESDLVNLNRLPLIVSDGATGLPGKQIRTKIDLRVDPPGNYSVVLFSAFAHNKFQGPVQKSKFRFLVPELRESRETCRVIRVCSDDAVSNFDEPLVDHKGDNLKIVYVETKVRISIS